VAWNRRSRGALPTTVTELVAMAPAASTGGRIPAAASRTSSRFVAERPAEISRMIRRVAPASMTASATAPTPPWMRVMSAAAIAALIGEPKITAAPRFAAARWPAGQIRDVTSRAHHCWACQP